MSGSYTSIVVTTNGPIATITLDRPEKRNALSLDTMIEITAALNSIADGELGDIDGVVIAANGPVFSAGHNFADMAGATKAQAENLFEVCTAMMDTIQSVPQPVVARVHALATAAGCQLVATCDLAVAAESAGFALPGGKGGLFCHTPLVAVSRNIGRKRALEMAFTGDPIDARTALDWGLVNRVVPDDDLDAAVDELVRRAVRGSAWSKAVGKRTFYEQVGLTQIEAYDAAIDAMSDNAIAADAQEGIAAFLAKRQPEFRERP